jgi:hypothetical protein
LKQQRREGGIRHFPLQGEALELGEIGTEVLVALSQLVQLIPGVLNTVRVPKGFFQILEQVRVVHKLGDTV